MGLQFREGKINWVQDLNASATSGPFPTPATVGVTPTNPGGHNGRVHVGVDYTCASGTMSLTVSLYGYTQTGTFPGWKFLGSLNSGNSIAANTATWSQSATQITFAEYFQCYGENYEQFKTAIGPPGGVSPVVSTYVGFPLE